MNREGRWRDNFFDEWSREMAYVLGYFYGDGSHSRSINTPDSVFLGSSDKDHIEKLAKLIGSPNVNIVNFENKKWKTAYRITAYSNRLSNKLTELGAPYRKSYVGMSYPSEMPSEFDNAFILGFMDSDGWVSTWQEKIQIGWIAKRSFLESVRDILTKNNIKPGYIYVGHGNDIHQLVYQGWKRDLQLIKFLYESNFDLAMNRKLKVIQSWVMQRYNDAKTKKKGKYSSRIIDAWNREVSFLL